jgi:hypothetical protein
MDSDPLSAQDSSYESGQPETIRGWLSIGWALLGFLIFITVLAIPILIFALG